MSLQKFGGMLQYVYAGGAAWGSRAMHIEAALNLKDVEAQRP
jgi:hypothetical protein